MTYHFYPGPQSLKMGLGVIQEIPARGNVTIAQEAAGCVPNLKKDSNKNAQVSVQPWVRLSDGKIVKGKSEKLSLSNTVIQNE